MRKALEKGSVITLVSSISNRKYTVEILSELGCGASCITYGVKDPEEKLNYVLKECFPSDGAERTDDSGIVWQDEARKTAALSRFKNAFNVQRELQNSAETQNDCAHLVDGLLEANNTFYILVDPRSAELYSKATDENLNQIFVTAKAIAREVGAQHSLGYLNLDIKPDNIMVYPATREMVLLLDFDSIVEKTQLSKSTASCSPRYAAPEQLQVRIQKICEATDTYAIGAIVFERIFGRPPQSEDRGSLRCWDFENNSLFEKMGGKVTRLTREFLEKALDASTGSRFRSTDEMICSLDELIKESRPGKRRLLSTLPRPRNDFIGREAELESIAAAFGQNSGRPVILRGIGGIGKTELAMNYAWLHRNDYDTVCFGKYTSSIAEMFSNEDFIFIDGEAEESAAADTTEDIPWHRRLKGLLDEKTLIIVDNLDTLEDTDLDNLLALGCSLLITSRCDFSEIEAQANQLEIGPLNAENQKELFARMADLELTDGVEPFVDLILRSVEGHTLLITLTAKQLSRGIVSLEEMAQRIEKIGFAGAGQAKVRHFKDGTKYGTIENILREVFSVASMTEEEHYVMRSLAVLGEIRIKKSVFLGWIGEEYLDALNQLTERNWIQEAGGRCSLHKIILQVYSGIHKPDSLGLPWASKVFDRLGNDLREGKKAINGFTQRYYNDLSHRPFNNSEIYDWANSDVFRLMCLRRLEELKLTPKITLARTLIENADLSKLSNAKLIIKHFDKINIHHFSAVCNLITVASDVPDRILERHGNELSKDEIITLLLCRMSFAVRDIVSAVKNLDRFGLPEADELRKEAINRETKVLISASKRFEKFADSFPEPDREKMYEELLVYYFCLAEALGGALFYYRKLTGSTTEEGLAQPAYGEFLRYVHGVIEKCRPYDFLPYESYRGGGKAQREHVRKRLGLPEDYFDMRLASLDHSDPDAFLNAFRNLPALLVNPDDIVLDDYDDIWLTFEESMSLESRINLLELLELEREDRYNSSLGGAVPEAVSNWLSTVETVKKEGKDYVRAHYGGEGAVEEVFGETGVKAQQYLRTIIDDCAKCRFLGFDLFAEDYASLKEKISDPDNQRKASELLQEVFSCYDALRREAETKENSVISDLFDEYIYPQGCDIEGEGEARLIACWLAFAEGDEARATGLLYDMWEHKSVALLLDFLVAVRNTVDVDISAPVNDFFSEIEKIRKDIGVVDTFDNLRDNLQPLIDAADRLGAAEQEQKYIEKKLEIENQRYSQIRQDSDFLYE